MCFDIIFPCNNCFFFSFRTAGQWHISAYLDEASPNSQHSIWGENQASGCYQICDLLELPEPFKPVILSVLKQDESWTVTVTSWQLNWVYQDVNMSGKSQIPASKANSLFSHEVIISSCQFISSLVVHWRWSILFDSWFRYLYWKHPCYSLEPAES